jgi:STE24 endopeptidase
MFVVTLVKQNIDRPAWVVILAIILFSVDPILASSVAVPVPTQGAIEYHHFGNLVWGLNTALTIAVPVIMLKVGFGRWASKSALRYGKYASFLALSTVLFIFISLVQLPLERLRIEKLHAAKNVSAAPLIDWVFGQILASIPLLIVSLLAAIFVFWIINRSPKRWWVWTTAVFSVLFLSYLVTEPWTKSFEPLGTTPLEAKILELAARSDIPSESIVLENCKPFDACDMAHVSGLGFSRTILLNKGLMAAYPESWTLQTVAHESKHFAEDDNLKGWLVGTLIVLILLYLLHRICITLTVRYPKTLGFGSMGHPASCLLMIPVLNLLFLIALPPTNVFRQHVELEADRFGLELTGQDQALAEMVSSWTTGSATRVPNPTVFFMLFRSSHPSDAERIKLANSYRAEKGSE